MSSWNRITRCSLVLALVAIAGSLLPATAIASHVAPERRDGNPRCAEVQPGSTEFKIEPVLDGTYSDGTLEVTLKNV